MNRFTARVCFCALILAVAPAADAVTVSLNNARPLSNSSAWGTVYANESVWMQYTIQPALLGETGMYDFKVTNDKNSDEHNQSINITGNDTDYLMFTCPNFPGESIAFTLTATLQSSPSVTDSDTKIFPCLNAPAATDTPGPAPTSTPQPTRPATGVADFALYE